MKKISLSKLDEFFAAVAASKNLYLPVDGAKVQNSNFGQKALL